MQRMMNFYEKVIAEGDPKTEGWPMIATPWPTIACIAVYLFIVKVGPKLMEERKAWDLKGLLIVYNFALVILSVYMVYEFIAATLDIPSFNFLCEPSHFHIKDDPKHIRLARICYIYYLSKIVEFWDTFFFILRKKNNQITFLHVYHHASMCVLWWMVCKWIPGGAAYFGATCNSFIHVVMYAYYMLSAMGPAVRPYLWWKRYLTRMQLMQFAAITGHTSYAIRLSCGFPNFFLWLQNCFTCSLMVLFLHFYANTYTKKEKKTD